MFGNGWFSACSFFPVDCAENLCLLNAYSHWLNLARPMTFALSNQTKAKSLGALDSDRVLKISNAAVQQGNLNAKKKHKKNKKNANNMEVG